MLARVGNRLYNPTMSLSSNFHRLQQIDTQLDQARNRLDDINKILNDSTAIEEVKAKAGSSEQTLTQQLKSLHDIETQVNDLKFKIEQNESTLYSGRIHNPKELQDLQNEVASLKRYQATLEDRQLEAMLAVEDGEEIHQADTSEVERVRGHLEEIHSGLRGEKSAVLGTLERLEVERQAAAAMIQTADLNLYEQLRRMRSGIAVARIIDRSCSACGSMLTPALVQAASSPTQIARCSSCSRILYAG